MKTKYFIFAASALVALASCSNEEYIGDNSLTSAEGDGSIQFSYSMPNATRADLYGAAAAEKLDGKFVVYGTKHADDEDATADNDAVVFDNFQVAYTASTAGTTASNSSDWEYVGKTSYNSAISAQTIKYWDYSAVDGYTFYAFSYHDDASGIHYPKDAVNDKVLVTKTLSDATSLYNKGYQVTVKNDAKLNNLYFSDRVPVAKEDYGKTVSLTFRNLGSKVRVGFYETIPGYTVMIDKFYIDEDAAAPATAPVVNFANMKDPKTDGFYASLQNVKTSVAQTINVTYNASTTATQVINRPKVTNPTGGYDYSLKIGSGTGFIDTELGTSAASPTWAVAENNGYVPVFPLEEAATPLLVKLDFTMYGEGGSNDVIHVRGARAIVPANYVQWKSNFAYTYLFKISDVTNGTTGAVDGNGDPITDPEGLKPITFDAIVVDMTNEVQQTITTVETNSITTYAEGEIVNEYKVSKPIYVAVTDNSDETAPEHEVITPSAIGEAATQAKVWKLNQATTEAEMLAFLNGSPITGLTKTAQDATIESTVPLTDGRTASIPNVKFTPATTGTYAYVYTRTAYVAPTYAIQTEGTYNESNVYYMLSGSGAYYVVSVPNAEAFNDNKSNLYIRTAAGTPGVYDVKVIKVAAGS